MSVQAPLRAPYPYPVVAGKVRAHLGLDFGMQLGYGVVDDAGRRLDSGVWHFGYRGKETPDRNPGARWLRAMAHIGEYLTDANKRWHLSAVAFESINFVAPNQALSAHTWGAFECIVLAHCSRLGLDIERVSPGAIKTIATGKGNAKKDAMLDAAVLRWGIERGNHAHNVADALFAADMLRRRVTGAVL